MREVLFHAKRVDTGEWVEGYFVSLVDNRGYKENRIYDGEADYEAGDIYPNQDAVDPETVGQFTGLPDKNGKKVFEGDICRVCLDPEICVGAVEYDERTASFVVKVGETEMVTFLDYMIAKHQVGDKVWIERIGNIHDNPELIGGAQNG